MTNISIDIAYLSDERISATHRILMAMAAYRSKQLSVDELVTLTGLPNREVARTTKRMIDNGFLTATGKLIAPRRVRNTDRDAANNALSNEFDPDKYPEVFFLAPMYDPLFKGRLEYLRDLTNPSSRKFWRFLGYHCRRNPDLNSHVEGGTREIVALIAASEKLADLGTESPGWALVTLIGKLTLADIRVTLDNPKFRPWLKRRWENQDPTVRSEISRLFPVGETARVGSVNTPTTDPDGEMGMSAPTDDTEEE